MSDSFRGGRFGTSCILLGSARWGNSPCVAFWFWHTLFHSIDKRNVRIKSLLVTRDPSLQLWPQRRLLLPAAHSIPDGRCNGQKRGRAQRHLVRSRRRATRPQPVPIQEPFLKFRRARSVRRAGDITSSRRGNKLRRARVYPPCTPCTLHLKKSPHRPEPSSLIVMHPTVSTRTCYSNIVIYSPQCDTRIQSAISSLAPLLPPHCYTTSTECVTDDHTRRAPSAPSRAGVTSSSWSVPSRNRSPGRHRVTGRCHNLLIRTNATPRSNTSYAWQRSQAFLNKAERVSLRTQKCVIIIFYHAV